MKQPTQQDLFERLSHRDVAGSELFSVLDQIRQQGGVVLTMQSICMARWRLSIRWPAQQRPTTKQG
jgi:hypothetical protein